MSTDLALVGAANTTAQGVYSLSGQVNWTAPIFQGAALRYQLEAMKKQWLATKDAYLQKIIAAFKDVADALATLSRLREERAARGGRETSRGAEARGRRCSYPVRGRNRDVPRRHLRRRAAVPRRVRSRASASGAARDVRTAVPSAGRGVVAARGTWAGVSHSLATVAVSPTGVVACNGTCGLRTASAMSPQSKRRASRTRGSSGGASPSLSSQPQLSR